MLMYTKQVFCCMLIYIPHSLVTYGSHYGALTSCCCYAAREWQGPASGERNVTAEFHPVRKKLVVRDGVGKELRFIDLRRTQTAEIRRPASNLNTVVSVRIDGEVDLVSRLLTCGPLQHCQCFLQPPVFCRLSLSYRLLLQPYAVQFLVLTAIL